MGKQIRLNVAKVRERIVGSATFDVPDGKPLPHNFGTFVPEGLMSSRSKINVS